MVVFFLDSLQLVGGPLFFNIAIAICSFLMVTEFYNAIAEKGIKPIKFIGYLCALLIIPLGVISTKAMTIVCASVIPIIIVLGLIVSILSNLRQNIIDVAVTIFGAIYVTFMCSFICATRAMEGGVYLVWYIFCGAWFCDIFAFLIGRAFGKHKFSKISPNKSIEGCIAGVIGTIVFYIVFSLILSHNLSSNSFAYFDVLNNSLFTNIPLLVFLGLIVSVFSQFGDFAASSIKRYTKIKDFSHIMPGHGGVLDRFDSILFVAPVVYFVFYIMMFS